MHYLVVWTTQSRTRKVLNVDSYRVFVVVAVIVVVLVGSFVVFCLLFIFFVRLFAFTHSNTSMLKTVWV